MFEVIQSYPNFDLVWVIQNGMKLFKTTIRKEPTSAQNEAIIAKRNAIKKNHSSLIILIELRLLMNRLDVSGC